MFRVIACRERTLHVPRPLYAQGTAKRPVCPLDISRSGREQIREVAGADILWTLRVLGRTLDTMGSKEVTARLKAWSDMVG